MFLEGDHLISLVQENPWHN